MGAYFKVIVKVYVAHASHTAWLALAVTENVTFMRVEMRFAIFKCLLKYHDLGGPYVFALLLSA